MSSHLNRFAQLRPLATNEISTLNCFLPDSKWHRRMILAGIEHEDLYTLPLWSLRRDESMIARLVSPVFETLSPDWHGLLLSEHAWGWWPNRVTAACPLETHAPLLVAPKTKLETCPACQAQVPLTSYIVFHAAIRGKGGVLLKLHQLDWPVVAKLIDVGCMDFKSGHWVELWREGWKLHYDILDPAPVDQNEYEGLMSLSDNRIKRFKIKKELLEMMGEAQTGWELAHKPVPQNGQHKELVKLLPQALLLDIPIGFKAPQRFGWRETPFHLMSNPDYLQALDAGNIGLACGLWKQANGTWLLIVGLDGDSDEFATELEADNPWLASTFCVRGQRGKKWFFMVDASHTVLEAMSHSTKIKRGDKDIGDWLATGKQGIVFGLHPCGRFYEHNGLPMTTIKPADFNLPEGCRFARTPTVEPKFSGAGGWARHEDNRRHVSTRTLRSALSYISPDERDTWFTVGCALKSWSLESDDEETGREIFDEWSAQSAKFDAGGQDKLWDSLQRQRSDAITVGSLFFLAHKAGWRTEEDDGYDDEED
jgi:hypothetical protein